MGTQAYSLTKGRLEKKMNTSSNVSSTGNTNDYYFIDITTVLTGQTILILFFTFLFLDEKLEEKETE